MMKSVLTTLPLFIWAVNAADVKEQVVLLVEAASTGLLSGTYRGIRDDLLTLIDMLKSDERELALATFVDKPNVAVGVGEYGGYPGYFAEDWCYSRRVEFTSDSEFIKAQLQSSPGGAGMDVLGGQFEALVEAVVDPALGWREDVARTIVLVTDSFGHSGEFANLTREVTAFNLPVGCVTGTTTCQTTGGFRSREPTRGSAVPWYGWGNYIYEEEFKREVELFAWLTCRPGGGTDQEKEEYKNLTQLFMPVVVESVKAFNWDVLNSDTATHCRRHEYPTYVDVRNALLESETRLVVIYAGEEMSVNKIVVDADQDFFSSRGLDGITEVWDFVLSDSEAGLGDVPTAFLDMPSHNWENLPRLAYEAITEISSQPFI